MHPVKQLFVFCLTVLISTSALASSEDLAGDELCQACHADIAKSFQSGPHAGTPEIEDSGVACESCHRPGQRHTLTMNPEHIFNPAKAPTNEAIMACQNCHGKMPHPWDEGQSDRDYYCLQCHSQHTDEN